MRGADHLASCLAAALFLLEISAERSGDLLGLGSPLLRQNPEDGPPPPSWLPEPQVQAHPQTTSLRPGTTRSSWHREMPSVGLELPTGGFWANSPAGVAVDSGTGCWKGGDRTGHVASFTSCSLPSPRQACLPGTQQGLHLLTTSLPKPPFLPSSGRERKRRNYQVRSADEETESYRWNKGPGKTAR